MSAVTNSPGAGDAFPFTKCQCTPDIGTTNQLSFAMIYLCVAQAELVRKIFRTLSANDGVTNNESSCIHQHRMESTLMEGDKT